MRHKTKLGAVALTCALALSACATKPAGRQAAAPRIDRQAEAQAQAFESFMRRARAIDPTFAGPAEVAEGLNAGAAYDPKTLEAGMIAYAALAALEEPRFVAGVRKAGRDKGLARRLAARPELAYDLPGGTAAAARASAALYRQGEPRAAEGRLVKTTAYGIQRQAWARAMVPDPRGRLERVKQSAVYRAAGDDRAQLYKAVAQGGGRSGGASSLVVQRGVALAALSVLGQADKGRALLSEPKSGMCLRMAKLDFHQCLSAAGPYYEDIYCLGQHAMIDPGQCVTAAAQGRSLARR
jgi:hypothetical protein